MNVKHPNRFVPVSRVSAHDGEYFYFAERRERKLTTKALKKLRKLEKRKASQQSFLTPRFVVEAICNDENFHMSMFAKQ